MNQHIEISLLVEHTRIYIPDIIAIMISVSVIRGYTVYERERQTEHYLRIVEVQDRYFRRWEPYLAGQIHRPIRLCGYVIGLYIPLLHSYLPSRRLAGSQPTRERMCVPVYIALCYPTLKQGDKVILPFLHSRDAFN